MSERPTTGSAVGVLCVDDNGHVAEALRIKLSRTPGFEWRGWLSAADDLVERAEAERPAVVLLDLDMPGADPFDALARLMQRRPEVKAVVFSGHVRKELIERAVDAGAWGYVSKSDGEEALIAVIKAALAGEFGLSHEAQAAWRS